MPGFSHRLSARTSSDWAIRPCFAIPLPHRSRAAACGLKNESSLSSAVGVAVFGPSSVSDLYSAVELFKRGEVPVGLILLQFFFFLVLD